MKVKDLIQQIEKYEDFDIEFMGNCFENLNYQVYENVEVCDIGYSSKVILLTGDNKC